jgi:hypothetical protein
MYDRQIASATATGDLVVLERSNSDHDDAYGAANKAIVREAQALARASDGNGPHRLIAMLVWEGGPRSGSDATAGFRQLARKAGYEEEMILTQ